MLRYTLVIALHFMLRYVFQKSSVVNLENSVPFFQVSEDMKSISVTILSDQ